MTYRNDTGLVSVTEVFSPYVRYDHINQDVLRAAAERGTLVHDAIADHLDGGFPVLDESVQGYFNAAVSFLENVLEIGLFEIRLTSDIHQFTGQLDLVCRMIGDSSWILVDWKTSALISKSWPLQLAAYTHLVRANNFQFNIGRMTAVQLRRDGTFKVNEYTNEHYHFNLFLNALAVMKYFNPSRALTIDWESL